MLLKIQFYVGLGFVYRSYFCVRVGNIEPILNFMVRNVLWPTFLLTKAGHAIERLKESKNLNECG